MKIHVIRTDGTEEHVEAPWRAIAGLIGAGRGTDTVNLHDGRVMVVDDDGWECRVDQRTDEGGILHLEMVPLHPVAGKVINPKATLLCRERAWIEGCTHSIVGDVAIVWDADCA